MKRASVLATKSSASLAGVSRQLSQEYNRPWTSTAQQHAIAQSQAEERLRPASKEQQPQIRSAPAPLGEMSCQKLVINRNPSKQASVPRKDTLKNRSPAQDPSGVPRPTFLPSGPGSWMLSGDQSTSPDSLPRAAPTPASCCWGPWVGWPPREAVV